MSDWPVGDATKNRDAYVEQVAQFIARYLKLCDKCGAEVVAVGGLEFDATPGLAGDCVLSATDLSLKGGSVRRAHYWTCGSASLYPDWLIRKLRDPEHDDSDVPDWDGSM